MRLQTAANAATASAILGTVVQSANPPMWLWLPPFFVSMAFTLCGLVILNGMYQDYNEAVALQDKWRAQRARLGSSR